MNGILVPNGPVASRRARCALCGMEPHGSGYCGHGPYSRSDPFCVKCYRAGDDCRHTPEQRWAFDRQAACPHESLIAGDDFASGRSSRLCGDCGALLQ